jgi:hypothetical protein
VKTNADCIALTNTYNATIVKSCEYLDAVTNALDNRCANERGRERSPSDCGRRDADLERIDLSAEGVAPNIDINATERLLTVDCVEHTVSEHDQPGTRSEHGQACGNAPTQWLKQPKHSGKFVHH